MALLFPATQMMAASHEDRILSSFGKKEKTAIKHYIQFVANGVQQPSPWSMKDPSGTGLHNVQSFNFGVARTSYTMNHSFPLVNDYAQPNLVKWTIAIPPQGMSNRRHNLELNIYQVLR